MSLSRRQFLKVAGGTAVGVGALGGRAVASAPAATTPGTLVVVTLYGGNDALNSVVPIGDPTYQRERATLAVAGDTALDIGEGFGLHPALAGFKALWDDEQLAIVHGVGFDELDRSHFHCMDVWQAGDVDDQTTGWLGRWLDRTGREPLDAVVVGTSLPLALRGARRSASVVPPGPFEFPGDRRLRSLVSTISAPDADRSPLQALVAGSTADLLEVVDTIGPILAGTAATDSSATESEARDGRNRALGAQLDVVAEAIEAGIPARVYAVDLGGFDTHANQAATHEALLGELDTAVTSFVGRMAVRPVTVLVYSEFGRRVAGNGSAGTDHGAAGTAFLAGAVRPGFHGEPPPLDDLVDGDLRTTVDFRRVYAGVLEGVLGIDAGDVLPDAPEPLTVA